jgi:hypothetical protein
MVRSYLTHLEAETHMRPSIRGDHPQIEHRSCRVIHFLTGLPVLPVFVGDYHGPRERYHRNRAPACQTSEQTEPGARPPDRGKILLFLVSISIFILALILLKRS